MIRPILRTSSRVHSAEHQPEQRLAFTIGPANLTTTSDDFKRRRARKNVYRQHSVPLEVSRKMYTMQKFDHDFERIFDVNFDYFFIKLRSFLIFENYIIGTQ